MKLMPDREKVIKGLEAMRDFLGVGLSSQTQVFEEDQKILEDAIAMLKEQENEIADKAITVGVSIPEQFLSGMRYDPSEDVVACTSCLICGKDIPLRRYESGPRVCSECKELIALLKEQGEVELCDRCGRRRLSGRSVKY